MQVYFYIDQWLAYNFIINYAVLDICSLIRKWDISFLKIAALSGIGALLSLVPIFYFRLVGHREILFEVLFHVFILLLLLVLITGIHIREFITSFITLMIIVCFLSGCILMVAARWQMGIIKELIVVGTVVFVVHLLIYAIRQEVSHGDNIFFVTILTRNGEKTVKALWDSGNRLTEPYSKRPVVIASKKVVEELKDMLGPPLYVPYYSLGNNQGLLIIYSLDKMLVWKEGDTEKKQYKKIYVGEDEKLFEHQQEYSMILNYCMG